MSRHIGKTIAVGILMLAPVTVFARDLGIPETGLVIAQRSCAACHAVSADRATSPNPKAPPFAAMAQTPGMTAIALRAALQTSHRTMPNLVLRKQRREDIIAYILQQRESPST